MGIGQRGIWFTGAVAVCGYLGFYTEWADNDWALVGMIFFLLVFYEVLWSEKTTPLHGGGQGRVEYIIPERGLRWIPQAPVYKAISKSVAPEASADIPSEQGTPEGPASTQ
jgi:hypothetical protein